MQADRPDMDAGELDIRIVDLPERRVVVRHHEGGLDTIDESRRPMYQRLIMMEAVGGPSILRFGDDLTGSAVDILVGAAPGFPGDDDLPLEHLPGGRYAVAEYEGDPGALHAARRTMLRRLHEAGHVPRGPLLQVHLMDPIDGVLQQEFQVLVDPDPTS